MTNFTKGIEFGKPTKREKELMLYLGESLANWIEKHKTERGEMLCAISFICSLMFSNQTPIKEIEAQCNEIDAFCEFLKLRARSS